MRKSLDLPLSLEQKTSIYLYQEFAGTISRWLSHKKEETVQQVREIVRQCVNQALSRLNVGVDAVTFASLSLDANTDTGRPTYAISIELSNIIIEKSGFLQVRTTSRRNILSSAGNTYCEEYKEEKLPKMTNAPYNVNIDCANGEFNRSDFSNYMSGIAAEAGKLGYSLDYPMCDTIMRQHVQFLANYKVPGGVISTRVFETNGKLQVGSFLESSHGKSGSMDYIATTGCHIPSRAKQYPVTAPTSKPKPLDMRSIECSKTTNYVDISMHVSKSASEFLARGENKLCFHGVEAANISALIFAQLQSMLDRKPVLSVCMVSAEEHLHDIGQEWTLRLRLAGMGATYTWEVAVRNVEYLEIK